ncbi:MAG: HAD family phosphatase [Deltaproteobacteria bacterium]|nr:HAD family phosphatase [Deltaproteobacteria bacterium]MBN2674071.1 HAD family phosphatase [Deltaproteobacteria bacterium]
MSFLDVRFPLVCFDLDGTLVDDTIYIWKTLHEGFRTDSVERNKAYHDYFDRKITYEQWFSHDLKLLRDAGANRDAMAAMCAGLQVMNGAMETLTTLRQNGHKIAVISGSIQLVIDVLFPTNFFDYVLINHIQFDNAGNICGGVHTPFDIEAKADGLRHLCSMEGIGSDKAVFVGDNENDVWIAKEAGYAIAFNCKSRALSEVCDVEIHEKNLTRILPLIS